MSLVAEAYKQKQLNKKKEQQIRQEALQKARQSMTGEARFAFLLDSINRAFADGNVRELTYEIEETSVPLVSAAIYSGKFTGYNVVLDGNILKLSQQIIEI